MNPSDHHMELYARQQGFPSYATMVAFYKAKTNPQPSQPPQSSSSLSGGLSSLLSLHPAVLLDYVRKKLDGATGQ